MNPEDILQAPGCEGAAPENLRLVTCSSCGQLWQVHQDLCGFQLRCAKCRTMVSVPKDQDGGLLPTNGEGRHVGRPRRSSPIPLGPRPNRFLRWNPIAEGASPELDERRIETWDDRRRWLNRSFIEVGLMMGAFLGPYLIIHFLRSGAGRTDMHPLSAFISAILVMVIAVVAGPIALSGLRPAKVYWWLVGLLGALGAIIVAFLWILLLQQSSSHFHYEGLGPTISVWGILATLFMVSVVPGICEEIGFRGLYQSRITALYGTMMGIILSGTVFGLCHGLTQFLPIHLGIGIYLGWLRVRSGSLLPGMFTHMAYNAFWVFHDAP